MATKTESKSQNDVKSDLLTRFNEMHNQGKVIREIAEECGVSGSTVRKYLRASTGKPPRAYKRSFLNCTTGQPFKSAESIKMSSLKVDNASIRKELREAEKKQLKSEKELSALKAEHRTLTRKHNEAIEIIAQAEEEIKKLQAQKVKYSTTLQQIKTEGFETKSLKAQLINNHISEIEKKGFRITDPNDPGSVISLHHFMIK